MNNKEKYNFINIVNNAKETNLVLTELVSNLEEYKTDSPNTLKFDIFCQIMEIMDTLGNLEVDIYNYFNIGETNGY